MRQSAIRVGVATARVGLCGSASAIAMLAMSAAPAWAQETLGEQSAPAQPSNPRKAGQSPAEAAADPQSGQTNASADAGTTDGGEGPGDDVVVTGIRQALATAQQTKRNADTFVDSVSATDISALPDRSIAEALQRVPGVTISRFAAGNDPSRFNAEGSGVLIRGLDKVRSEFNGRDSFSASVGDGRGLSFNDITPETTAGVDVYKNQTADMIEGGIAGVINIRTRLPFDSNKAYFGFSADVSYGDLRERGTPTVSGVISQRWSTGIGEIGVLGSLAYSELKTRADGVLVNEFYIDTNLRPGQSLTVPGDTNFTRQDYDRKREGRYAALQWRSLDSSAELTLQYFYSKGRESSKERNANIDSNANQLRVYPGTSITVDGTRVTGGNFIEPNGNYGYTAYPLPAEQPLLGPNFQTQSRYQRTRRETADYSAHLKLTPTDKLRVDADFQYIDSSRTQLDFTTSFLNRGTYSFSNFFGNDVPRVSFGLPYPGAPATYFTQPGGYIPFVAMDHIEDIKADEYSGRLDLTYDLDSNWFDSVQAGVRYADYDQDAKWSAYNWGTINTFWDPTVTGYLTTQPAVQAQAQTITNFAHQGYDLPTYLYPSFAAMEDYYAYSAALSGINAGQSARGGIPRWYPAAARPGAVGGYLPGEVNVTGSKDFAAYLRFNFALAERIKANVGVRYVRYDQDTSGGVGFSANNSRPTYCDTPTTVLQQQQRLVDARCFVPLADLAFANGATLSLPRVKNKYDQFLPSLNIRAELAPDMFARFAVSKALTRPGLGLLRNFSIVQQAPARGFNSAGTPIDTIAACAGVQLLDANGNAIPIPQQCRVATAIFQPTTGGPPYSANSAGNPDLKPETAWNFDLSYEWYFNQTGSLTLTGFYKRLSDTLQQGQEVRSFTNNGVTRDVVYTTLVNGGKATIKGFEIGYQQFFTFLPGPLSHLGVQANYTYIDSSGRTTAIYGGSNAGGIAQIASGLDFPLVDLSKHNYNLVGIYQDKALEARVAYNWRSRRFLSPSDSVDTTKAVFAQAYGQLDASLFLTVNDRFRIGVQGVNLTASVTRTEWLSTDPNATIKGYVPRGWFTNDRRFSVVARATF